MRRWHHVSGAVLRRTAGAHRVKVDVLALECVSQLVVRGTRPRAVSKIPAAVPAGVLMSASSLRCVSTICMSLHDPEVACLGPRPLRVTVAAPRSCTHARRVAGGGNGRTLTCTICAIRIAVVWDGVAPL